MAPETTEAGRIASSNSSDVAGLSTVGWNSATYDSEFSTKFGSLGSQSSSLDSPELHSRRHSLGDKDACTSSGSKPSVWSASSGGSWSADMPGTPNPSGLPSKAAGQRPLPITSLNHVSIHCADVMKSVEFYVDVLGFCPVKRPHSLRFEGAWLFKDGIGIHLLGSEDEEEGSAPRLKMRKPINPKADHLSFQCDNMTDVEEGLLLRNIPFVRQIVEEGGIEVEQLFFHDPDGHMIEICNCNLLPVIPLAKYQGFQDLTPCAAGGACHRLFHDDL